MHLVYRNEVKIQKILRISLHNPLESSFSEVLADSKLKISWQSFFAMRKAKHIPVFINGRIVSRPREVIFTFCWSCIFFFLNWCIYERLEHIQHLQQMTTKTSGHWSSWCVHHEGTWRKKGTKLKLFSLKRLRKELMAPSNGVCCEEGSKLLEVSSGKKGVKWA